MLAELFAFLRTTLRRWFLRDRQETALRDELAFHREQLVSQYREEGMTPAEAEHAAAKEFGAFADAYVEESRDTWRPSWIRAVGHDLRFATRSMMRSPSFSLLAVVTLALGIGACTTMFSVIQSTVRSALPVEDQDRLVFFWEDNLELGIDQFSQSIPNFVDYRDRLTSFESLIGTNGGNVSLALETGAAMHARAVAISAGFSRAFGWPLLRGRDFLSAEDAPGGPAVAIISERVWREQFNGRENVIGATVLIDREPHQVVGVVGRQADLLGDTDVWRPLRPDPTRVSRDDHWVTVIGKLKTGVAIDQAEAEIDAVAATLRAEYPDTMKGWGAHLETLTDQIIPPAWRDSLNLLFAAVGLLLLIACANVANLLLSRALIRENEIAIRISLGATRGQIVRQLLCETLVLAAAGTAVGLLLTYWGLDALRTFAPTDLPRIDTIALSTPSFVFAALTCLGTTLVAGLLPALKGTGGKRPPGQGMAVKTIGGSKHRNRLRDLLVMIQVALSLALLVGAGLLIRSFGQLSQESPGFDADNVLTFSIGLDEATYGDPSAKQAFYRRVGEELRALPGVEAVAQTSGLPFGDGGTSLNLFPAEAAALSLEESVQSSWRIVDANYFAVLRIPLVEGRAFDDRDTNWDTPVIMLSRRLAEQFWPGESALGKRVNPGGGDNLYTVIGVVEDIRLYDLSGVTERPQMYFPLTLWAGWRYQSFAVRTSLPPESLASSVRETMRRIDPAQPIYALDTLAAMARRDLRLPNLSAWLLSIFAGVALLLATVGIYAVMSTSVAQRTREIGVRMALGAAPMTVHRMILRHGIQLVGSGVLIGIVLSAAAGKVLESVLFNTTAFEIPVLGAAAATLLITALLAVFQPARRATRIEPIVALRAE
ncbi:ABC transporter permease [Synoicihabitans lomoniglobus]|uniref:ABC transporter permease n=1 Tax=Synoicihabitans lomoniglobus TaxID=2909285 RepID=A0AAE9ZYX0_9BACT|nr:ABC transporter permease [Opitutaceae bacterium LMO-M01]WED63823.1 ABC transporter permease [Opitutaceae bacterium LMO-M01]